MGHGLDVDQSGVDSVLAVAIMKSTKLCLVCIHIEAFFVLLFCSDALVYVVLVFFK